MGRHSVSSWWISPSRYVRWHGCLCSVVHPSEVEGVCQYQRYVCKVGVKFGLQHVVASDCRFRIVLVNYVSFLGTLCNPTIQWFIVMILSGCVGERCDRAVVGMRPQAPSKHTPPQTGTCDDCRRLVLYIENGFRSKRFSTFLEVCPACNSVSDVIVLSNI